MVLVWEAAGGGEGARDTESKTRTPHKVVGKKMEKLHSILLSTSVRVYFSIFFGVAIHVYLMIFFTMACIYKCTYVDVIYIYIATDNYLERIFPNFLFST